MLDAATEDRYTAGVDVLNPASLPPDPVVEAYKKDVDRTLLDKNLALSHSERIEQLQRFVAFLYELQQAGRRAGHGLDDSQAD
jgi:hypothetical protein